MKKEKLQLYFTNEQQMKLFDDMIRLSVKMQLSPPELIRLGLVYIINDNCELISDDKDCHFRHDEKAIYSEQRIKGFISRGENIPTFRKNI